MKVKTSGMMLSITILRNEKVTAGRTENIPITFEKLTKRGLRISRNTIVILRTNSKRNEQRITSRNLTDFRRSDILINQTSTPITGTLFQTSKAFTTRNSNNFTNSGNYVKKFHFRTINLDTRIKLQYMMMPRLLRIPYINR